MLWIGRARCQHDAVGRQAGRCPTGRRKFAVSHIGSGRRVDDVNSFVLGNTAVVDVSVDVRLHVPT